MVHDALGAMPAMSWGSPKLPLRGRCRQRAGLGRDVRGPRNNAAGDRAVVPTGEMPIFVVIATSIAVLCCWIRAYAGGALMAKAALRVTFWGVLAMALTAGVGALFGAAL